MAFPPQKSSKKKKPAPKKGGKKPMPKKPMLPVGGMGIGLPV